MRELLQDLAERIVEKIDDAAWAGEDGVGKFYFTLDDPKKIQADGYIQVVRETPYYQAATHTQPMECEVIYTLVGYGMELAHKGAVLKLSSALSYAFHEYLEQAVQGMSIE